MIRVSIDKQQVASSFSKAAVSYDSVAELQREVGTHLMQLLPQNLNPERLVDLGCGTGYFTEQLLQGFPTSDLVGLDLAEGMLQFSRGRIASQERLHWLCGDAENLPLADRSVDLIFSSLAIQWCLQPEQLFAEIERVLKPGGQFWFSTLGPSTLHELREAWAEVDEQVHVNHFIPFEQMEQSISAGLQITHWQEAWKRLGYQQLSSLTSELKKLGAHNVNEGRPQGLSGRQKVRGLQQAYESFRDHDGLLPASYQLLYGCVSRL